MSLSIITPHYNDFEGLQQIYDKLQNQTLDDWEWNIIDDLSAFRIRQNITNWHKELGDKRVNIVLNSIKTNASVCRNKGADISSYTNLIFLDTDDFIEPDFVENRKINFTDFAIFPNYCLLNEKGEKISRELNKTHLLDNFLSANFLWQTTCILWNRHFFYSIGKFHPDLQRLQDVELAIRGLQKSTNYKIIDNNVDFFYNVKPIRQRKNFLKIVCESVYLLNSELLDTSLLSKKQLKLLSGYYFLSVRYLEKSESKAQVHLVYRNLKLFYKKGYINVMKYIVGFITLKIYNWHMLSGHNFLRINRFVFKPKTT